MSDINFIEVDADSINTEMINNFETALGATLYPGDERKIFLEQELSLIVAIKNSMNENAKKNLLRYATGELLDALGDFYSCPRIAAKYSTVTMRITLSSILTMDLTIPKGTRVTPDGTLYFATAAVCIISAGSSYRDFTFTAMVAGSFYNGYVPGQIKTLVDPISYIASVSNVDTSNGGADIEPDDDGVNIWSGYRERIRLAPTSFSVAGPTLAYEFFALSADSTISDVYPHSPSAGCIEVVVLCKNGTIPSSTVLNAVSTALSDRKVRPLTDNVSVVAPTQTSYDIALTYYISKDDSANETAIRNAIEGTASTSGVIDDYILWQCSKLGRAINPDYLRKLMMNAGAERITITSPVYTALDGTKVAKLGTKTIMYGGLE